jgi:hypothetical protein
MSTREEHDVSGALVPLAAWLGLVYLMLRAGRR